MKRLFRYYKWCVAALTVTVLILCQNHLELREIQDVAGISIDPAGNGKYKFGLELAETDKQNGFTINSEVMTVEAETLQNALAQAGLDNEYPVVLTHCGLIVLNEQLPAGEMNKICKNLLADWRGQTDAYICVADGCAAEQILRRDENENLRAGLLSAQVKRASKQGICPTDCMPAVCNRYLAGKTVSLPRLALSEHGYRIVGSTLIGGERYAE